MLFLQFLIQELVSIKDADSRERVIPAEPMASGTIASGGEMHRRVMVTKLLKVIKITL